MARKLGKMMPKGQLCRIRPHKPYLSIERPTRYVIDDLDACRAAFLAAMQIADHSWPEV